jgi:hypothetical protein
VAENGEGGGKIPIKKVVKGDNTGDKLRLPIMATD